MNSFSLPQNVDKWSFDVFALNEASGEHALKFIFYELLTRYDLISRFKVQLQGYNVSLVTATHILFVSLKQGETKEYPVQFVRILTILLQHA